MHAHARRMAAPKCSVGVPVSQYDMALVLLAFSAIPLDIMVSDCNVFGYTVSPLQIALRSPAPFHRPGHT